MVTTAAFNALLKLVEEPPPHVKFIFATTEPEKVLTTIKSRTFHYRFRLIPPAVLRDFLADLCGREGLLSVYQTPSKTAVPTRTWVAPSSTATSKSWLIPMESPLSPARAASSRSERK